VLSDISLFVALSSKNRFREHNSLILKTIVL
jgi:hypothetical protein